jgi:hypothetical protein
MAATNWTIVTKRSDDNVVDLFPLTTKMTKYKNITYSLKKKGGYYVT